ncbi:septum site-determining protein minD, TadZ-like protein [Bifidobacterium leontopitheci]|uniref:Septum site-determining protein minD, TadZ-like protein n=1 Tax=Bifidobacterium leontopitheci TaxID=2650774 RepID=A0A6I1GE79_9BIFI|nr:septum site-determining protein minD, TadZ-like protein [Bifidobacterium leontopitheci]KAB7789943.1 septum site-determining protein minD, TadZ-like protein [Bifidobacterium leontopitheci]
MLPRDLEPCAADRSLDVSADAVLLANASESAVAYDETPMLTPTERGNITVFCAASGGIGSSTLAAMTAWRLKQRGRSCALADCDTDAGGLDVLIGIEQEDGLRLQTIDAPLGRLDAAALNRELPHWEGMPVLASHPWRGERPEPWTMAAVLRALGKANDTVIADAGGIGAWTSMPMLHPCTTVLLVELTVLGLARGRAALGTIGDYGGRAPLMLGVTPRGSPSRRDMVGREEAESYLHAELLGTVTHERKLQSDMARGLGIRAIGRRSRTAVDALADAIEAASDRSKADGR